MPPPDRKLTLTVVTPSLNHGAFIGAAVDSAQLSDAYGFEHIVVDADSTDETHAVLRARPRLKLVIRPELDSHQALNHALELAQGDVIAFLNADDRYEPGVLDRVMAHFQANPQTMSMCGVIRVFTEEDGVESVVELFGHCGPEDMPLELTFGNPGFNSWFFRRSLLQQLGGFREQYRFGADRDLLLRAYAISPPVALPALTYHYRMHTGSRTMDPRGTNREAMIRDHLAMISAEMDEVWTDHPKMRLMLTRWDALERFKLFVRAVRFGIGSIPGTALGTPWWHVPAGLLLRRRWLKILRSGGQVRDV